MTNKKHFWLVIGAGVLVLLIVIIYFVGLAKKTTVSEPKVVQPTAQQKTVENLNKSLEAVTESTKVEVPSVNPLDSAVPKVNPIEKTNPFKTKNPFE